MASLMGCVASFRAEKLALSLRTHRDDFKLAVSDASSMKGVSTMQKETIMKTFLASLASLAEDDGLAEDFDGQHGVILLVDGFRRPRRPLVASSLRSDS